MPLFSSLRNRTGAVATATATNTTTAFEPVPTPLDPAVVGVREGTTVKETVATAAIPTTSYVQTSVPVQVPVTTTAVAETVQVQKSIAPVILEKREIAPVVHERIRKEEIEEIHPVIHREREKTEIHKITQPIHTSAVMGVIAQEATLAPQIRAEIRTPGMAPPALILPRREEIAAQKVRLERPPIVLETEKKRIIEEVTPLVYREVVEPHVIKFTQPIYEKIVEGDVYVTQVLPARVEQVAYQQTVLPVTTTVAAPVATNVEVANTFVAEKERLAQPTNLMTQQPHTSFIRESAIMQPGYGGVPPLSSTAYATGVSTPPLATSSYGGFAQPFGGQQFATTGLGAPYAPLGPQVGYRGLESSAMTGSSLAQPSLAQPSLAQPSLAQPSLAQPSLGQQMGSALGGMADKSLGTGSFMGSGLTSPTGLTSSV